jgi:pilus assembly protein CpaB
VNTSPLSRSGRSPVGGPGRSPGRSRPLAVLALLAGWPRRLLAGTLLLLAALVWLQEQQHARDAIGSRVAVLAAAHDLGAGAVLGPADVRLVRLDPAAVPEGALRSPRAASGRTVAGAVRRGEPITDVRLVGPGLTAGLGRLDSVAVPVRLADGETAALLRAGDRVDLLATPAEGGEQPQGDGQSRAGTASGEALAVATGVRVLAVLTRSDGATEDGVLVLVAAAEDVARRLAGTAAHSRLSVALRPP